MFWKFMVQSQFCYALQHVLHNSASHKTFPRILSILGWRALWNFGNKWRSLCFQSCINNWPRLFNVYNLGESFLLQRRRHECFKKAMITAEILSLLLGIRIGRFLPTVANPFVRKAINNFRFCNIKYLTDLGNTPKYTIQICQKLKLLTKSLLTVKLPNLNFLNFL